MGHYGIIYVVPHLEKGLFHSAINPKNADIDQPDN